VYREAPRTCTPNIRSSRYALSPIYRTAERAILRQVGTKEGRFPAHIGTSKASQYCDLSPSPLLISKMKFFQTGLVLLASGLASARPTSNDVVDTQLDIFLDTRSINEANLALQVLERRFDPRQCRIISTTLRNIGTSAAK
jgi:hypothetical protein